MILHLIRHPQPAIAPGICYGRLDVAAQGASAGAARPGAHLAGGAPVKVCDVPVSVGLSGSWGRQGDILFSTVQGDRIFKVPAAGGTPVDATAIVEGGRRLVWPRHLPDGRRFLYTLLTTDSQGQIMLAEADGRGAPLVAATSQAQWIGPDWLVFVREGTLVGQRVDLAAGRPVGGPVSIIGPRP